MNVVILLILLGVLVYLTYRASRERSKGPQPNIFSFRSVPTLILAAIALEFNLSSGTFDGGNVDFYRKPLEVAWFALTLASFVRPWAKKPAFIIVRNAWWLQIFVPILVFPLCIFLVQIYKPYPLPGDKALFLGPSIYDKK